MSLVELRVELPAYSHSFTIQVPPSATVIEVKQSIQAACKGGPRADGQRLICRGRILEDEERLDIIWKTLDEARTVHLAVHPTAWTSSPPTAPGSSPAPSSTPSPAPQASRVRPHSTTTLAQDLLRELQSQSPSTSPQPAVDLIYVMHKHQTALQVLMQRGIPVAQPSNLMRGPALRYVESLGWEWPSILDEDFPEYSPGGVKYTQVVHDGASFLKLEDASQTPTPVQVHALRVLTYTLAILKSDPPASVHRYPTPPTVTSSAISPQVSALLQQLGLRNLPANLNIQAGENGILEGLRNQIPAPDLPQVRPMLLPITFILLRIALLLYFFAPARKPLIGVLIVGWAAYEIWTRHVRQLNPRNAPQPGAAAVANNGAIPGNNNNNGQENERVAAGPTQPGAPTRPHAGFVDSFANINIPQEEQMLDGPNNDRPSFFQKLSLFTSLFYTTLHPAVWDRRRALLRQREGRIRTEANARRVPDDGSDTPENRTRLERRGELIARHERRPEWVREYVERVVENDWVEE